MQLEQCLTEVVTTSSLSHLITLYLAYCNTHHNTIPQGVSHLTPLVAGSLEASAQFLPCIYLRLHSITMNIYLYGCADFRSDVNNRIIMLHLQSATLILEMPHRSYIKAAYAQKGELPYLMFPVLGEVQASIYNNYQSRHNLWCQFYFTHIQVSVLTREHCLLDSFTQKCCLVSIIFQL